MPLRQDPPQPLAANTASHVAAGSSPGSVQGARIDQERQRGIVRDRTVVGEQVSACRNPADGICALGALGSRSHGRLLSTAPRLSWRARGRRPGLGAFSPPAPARRTARGARGSAPTYTTAPMISGRKVTGSRRMPFGEWPETRGAPGLLPSRRIEHGIAAIGQRLPGEAECRKAAEQDHARRLAVGEQVRDAQQGDSPRASDGGRCA